MGTNPSMLKPKYLPVDDPNKTALELSFAWWEEP
jgi:hypothetical protein